MRTVLFIAVVLCMSGLVSATDKPKWDCHDECIEANPPKLNKEFFEYIATYALCMDKCLT